VRRGTAARWLHACRTNQSEPTPGKNGTLSYIGAKAFGLERRCLT
jgi:hypothetical protein